MKKVLAYLFIAVLVFLTYMIGVAIIKGFFTNDEKQTLVGDHFNVYFHQVSSWDAENIADELKKNYHRIIEDLQAPALPKIHVFLNPHKKEFHQNVGFDALGAIKE